MNNPIQYTRHEDRDSITVTVPAKFVLDMYKEGEWVLLVRPEDSRKDFIHELGNQVLHGVRVVNQRLLDLVRYRRSELHQNELITDEEYAALVELGSEAARRLETYDELRARNLAQAEEIRSLQSKLKDAEALLGEEWRRSVHATAGNLQYAREYRIAGLVGDIAVLKEEVGFWKQAFREYSAHKPECRISESKVWNPVTCDCGLSGAQIRLDSAGPWLHSSITLNPVELQLDNTRLQCELFMWKAQFLQVESWTANQRPAEEWPQAVVELLNYCKANTDGNI